MDAETRQAIRSLSDLITGFGRRLDAIEATQRTSQLQNASITGTSITVYDTDGETPLQYIGAQGDGTAAVVNVNGPQPPTPTAPVVTAATLGLTVTWDGATADDIPLPADFDHVAVHVSTTDGFTPDAGTLRATLNRAGDISLTPLTTDPHYVVLVAYSASGVASAPSVQTAGTPDAVVSTDILDGIVTTVKLADDAVTNAKIADTAVDANKLADGSVSASKVVEGAIGTDQLALGAVDTAQLASGAVDASKILAGAVGTSQLGDAAVTTGKIAADAVTATEISAGAIGATELAANAVVAGKIAAGTVGANELAANSVVAGKIAAGVVDATAIASGAVTTAKLAALAVTANELAANSVVAGKIATGAITAETIAAGAITADLIGSGTVGQPIAFGSTLESTNYVAGSEGWRIDGDTGQAEFNDRVTINSGNGGELYFAAEDVFASLDADATTGMVIASSAGITLGTIGGIIALNSSEVDVEGTLILTNTTDASTAAGNAPALVIGDYANAHARFDGNEIVAMASNGGAMANYFINQDASTNAAGDVVINRSRFAKGSGNANDAVWVNNISGTDISIVLSTNAAYVSNGTNPYGTRRQIIASNVSGSSDMRLKTSKGAPEYRGIDLVRDAPASVWQFTDAHPMDANTWLMGPMAQDIPAELRPVTKDGVESISLVTQIGILWDAMRSLDAELDAWRAGAKKPLPQRKS